MQAGDLVQRVGNHSWGIVISINGLEAEVLFGDGSREIVPIWSLVAVLFKPDALIPASFPEMVDAYIKLRGFK